MDRESTPTQARNAIYAVSHIGEDSTAQGKGRCCGYAVRGKPYSGLRPLLRLRRQTGGSMDRSIMPVPGA